MRGCGDCSIESNCLSVEPKETEFGRKRKINLSSCNKDFSCLNGFCPSFVTVEGATRRKREGVDLDVAAKVQNLPQPEIPSLEQPFDLLVAGVGGTGVVTVGALITMAAHLEGKGSSVLDFTGFAQKFGTVISYIRLGSSPKAINQVRTESGAAQAVIGCDAVVASSTKASIHYRKGTNVVLNRAEMPTGDLVLRRDADLQIDEREQLVRQAVGQNNVLGFDANALSETLMGDAVIANIIMLGAAWQQGLVPVSEIALKQAITLNGVAIGKNTIAFDIGRLMAATPEALTPHLRKPNISDEKLTDMIAHRAAFLVDYQNQAYADLFTTRIADFHATLPADAPDELATAAAKSLFKLMAYKDEYEVARLFTQTGFSKQLKEEFEGDFKLNYHFAPPFLPLGKDTRGRPFKRSFGPWMTSALGVLAKMKGLRGTPFDPFGRSADRKLDRELVVWFVDVLDKVSKSYSPENFDKSLEILSASMQIRGYGPVREQAAEETRNLVRTALM